MDKFSYTAKDNQGKTLKGTVEGKDIKQVARILKEKGLLVIGLKPKSESLLSGGKGVFSGRVSVDDKVNFTRQLSTMMNAGLRLTEALAILESQGSSAMRKVVGEILREIEAGGSLTSALEKQPEVFDAVYVALIRAGESAGVLDKILNRLADNLEKQKEFRSKVKGAMIYPAIVIIGMILVASIMIIFVIPKMTTLYEEFQAELPLPTKILLAISRLSTTYWWLGLLMIIGLVLGWRFLFKIPEFRKRYDQFTFRLPVFGKLKKQIMLTEFTRTLGLLVGSGVLIVEALQIVRQSLGSPVYKDAVDQTVSDVEKGFPFAASLARTEVFPTILQQMISVGEETGKLDEVLGKVATYFEQESEATVKGLTVALEPIIMVVLGVGVGFLIISIIMPIYNLTNQF